MVFNFIALYIGNIIYIGEINYILNIIICKQKFKINFKSVWDFIFSIISEEFGFMAVLIVVSLFLLIIIRGFKISRKASDPFSKYLAFGITFELAFQCILNLMVVVGLIPVTG